MSLDVHLTEMLPVRIYSDNITHNLAPMAREAGLYEVLWRPENVGAVRAGDIVATLLAGIALLRSDPDRFRALSPENGWGTYEGLVRFVEAYIEACENNPDATIEVSR